MCGCCVLRQRCVDRVFPKDVSAEVGSGYVAVIRDISGADPLSGTRKRASVWGRYFVAYQMSLDGFTQEQIGRTIRRDRCTIPHCIKNVNMMLDSPEQYPWEYGVWKKFRERLSLGKT